MPATRNFAIISLFAFAFSAFALTLSTDDEEARQSALAWLRVVDSGNYRDATLMLSNYARAVRDWPNYLAAERAQLGRVKNRQTTEVKHAAIVPGDPETRQHAIIRFWSAFEKKIVVEEIVVARTACCREVAGYKILSAQKK